MSTKLENPAIEELRDYEVREDPDLFQAEKETTIQVDKDEKVVNFCSRVGSHIRTVINSGNDNIKIRSALVDGNELQQLRVKIPLDSLTVSVKSSPKQKGYMSGLLV